MSWFTAALFFKGNDSAGEDSVLWEERFVLLEADTEQEAMLKVQQYGELGAVSYQTATGGEFCWKFSHVGRIFSVQSDNLINGVEIFSRFLRPSEVASLSEPFPDD
jgi:hypothetical protein